MEITTVGSIKDYYYNCKTGKLQTAEGGDNAFTKWVNGEICNDELPKEINGYDFDLKESFLSVLDNWNDSISITPLKNKIKEARETMEEDDDLFLVQFEVNSPVLTTVKVNGEVELRSASALDMIVDDFELGKYQYPTMINNGNNDSASSNNSINIGVGNEYILKNGSTMKIFENKSYGEVDD